MDLDDLEAPSKVPARVSKFAPKSSKLKPKPKSEPTPKPEPQPNSSFPKPEPQEFVFTARKNEDDVQTTASTQPNGTVKMDVEPKSEAEEESLIQHDPMDEDSDDDTVMREIDVFLAASIDAETQFYVLQCPLRPSWRPYDLDELCEEVKLNPVNSEVEIDLPIDLESINIDKEFADKHNVKKQTLVSSRKPTHANGCAIGLLMGNKLHLHPTHAVVQLRPSLQHLSSACSKRKHISTGANATVKIEGSTEGKSIATSKKQNQQMEPSIEQKSDVDEKWVPLKYHSCKSDISSRYLRQMVAQESSPINFAISAYDYLTSLCPGVSSNILPKGLYKRYLEKLPVEERLKKILLTEGRPLHRFSAIKHYASEYSEEELLGFLQQHARLVQGLWAAKSSLLPTQDIDTSTRPLETLARDYVLILFTKKLKVQAFDVGARRTLAIHVKRFLNIFGSEGCDISKSGEPPKLHWKFREVPDGSFKKLYPDVVEKQEEIFKRMEQDISKIMEKGESNNVKGRPVRKDAVANRLVNK